MLNTNIPIPNEIWYRRRIRGRAFTIVELLISIAVIAILIGVALFGLQAARRSAGRTTSMNALRQMMVAYNTYTNDNDGRLMPGYIDPQDFAAGRPFENLIVRVQGGQALTPGDKASYVWRLAPYLDHQWLPFMTDYRSTDLNNRFAVEYDQGIFGEGSGAAGTNLCIALRPSFGLNSVYLGGDGVHGNPINDPWDPNTTIRVAAMRMAEVKNPAKIIVFAPTRGFGDDLTDVSADVPLGYVGYAHLSPPFTGFKKNLQEPENMQWHFDDAATEPDHIVYTGAAARAGLPIDRYGGNRVVLSHLDGSVTSEDIRALGPTNASPITPMSRWSPFAVGFH